MGISPDAGGRVGLGRPLQPDYFELETTAQTQVMKAGLGLVPNTLEIPFTQIGGNLWKYQAAATKPEIPMDVLQGVVYPELETKSKAELENFQKLVNELPIKMKLELDDERKKTLEDRQGSFWVLEKIIRFYARALTWVENVQELRVTEFEENAQKNNNLTLLYLKNWLSTAEEIVKNWTLIEKKETDAMLKRRFRENCNLLNPYILNVREIVENSIDSKESRATLRLITSANALQKEIFDRRLGNALCLIESLLETLKIGACALLFSKGSAFAFSLSFLHPRTFIKDESEETFGTVLDKAVNYIASRIEGLNFPQMEEMKSLTLGSSFLFNALVLSAADINITNPETAKFDTSSLRSLACQLALCLITKSQFLRCCLQPLVSQMNLHAEAARLIQEILPLFPLNIFWIAGLKGTKTGYLSDTVVRGLREELLQHFEKLLNILQATEISTSTRESMSLMREAQETLKAGDLNAYLNCLYRMCSPFQINLETLMDESLKEVNWASRLLTLLKQVTEQNKSISIMREAA